MVTRVRIDAEGSTVKDVVNDLDAAYAVIAGAYSPNFTVTSTGGAFPTTYLGTSSSASPSVFPSGTEFIEEVIESFVTELGVVRRRGRRTIRFFRPDPPAPVATKKPKRR